ncbi:MAG: hypothetical protein ACK559_21520, partial [bacterium]
SAISPSIGLPPSGAGTTGLTVSCCLEAVLQLHVFSRQGEEPPTLLDGCTVSAAQQAGHL